MEEPGWFSPGFGGKEERRGDGENEDFRGTKQAKASIARGLGSTVENTFLGLGGSVMGADGGCGGGLVEPV